MRRFIQIFFFILIFQSSLAVIEIKMTPGAIHGIPPKGASDPRSVARRAVFEAFRKKHPDIRIVHSGGLELSKAHINYGFLMSMAGETAPDIFYVNFKQYHNYIDQGFCHSLDSLIQKSPGVLDSVHPKILDVLKSYDGKIYAMPWYQVSKGLYYRKDHFLEAGLDPDRPPRTWEEFYEYGKKLVESKPGRKGFVFYNFPGGKTHFWVNFVWQAGGQIVKPIGGQLWTSALDTQEASRALDFYKKIIVGKWVSSSDGKTYGPMAYVSGDAYRDISDGKVSMWFSYCSDVVLGTLTADINPAYIGIAQMPAGPAGLANEVNAGMWAINSQVKDPGKIEACWKFIEFFMGDEAARINTEKFVGMGYSNLVNPVHLEKFGYEDLARRVDPDYVEANKQLFKNGHPEPYGRNCHQVGAIVDKALDEAVLNPEVPNKQILKKTSAELDRVLLGGLSSDASEKDGWKTGFILITLIILGIVFWRILNKRNRQLVATTLKDQRKRVLALYIIPAIASILFWNYYPLIKGLFVAFLDYKLLSTSDWVGLGNFKQLLSEPLFFRSIFNSFLFVFLSVSIGFFIPIFLALAINEIPRFKAFFRIVFYLPAMTSPILIAFLWRYFYDASETGLLNSVLAPLISTINWMLNLNIDPAIDWLGNPSLAMFSVVIPGIWLAAGPGSILYLAALKNVPHEHIEAAEMDGASWIQKIRFVVFPNIKPLMLINLLGVIIAGFKSLESIFILTGGGPLNSTHTMGLEVWTNAFMFLKFGYATAAAWVMGTILLGFSLLQIRLYLHTRLYRSKL